VRWRIKVMRKAVVKVPGHEKELEDSADGTPSQDKWFGLAKSLKDRKKAEMTLGSAGLAARATH
jgi:hypothetical protein